MDESSIDKLLRDAVRSGAVPNVAAIAADADGIIYRGAAGPKQADGADSVAVDTQFRIMSMTKMVTTVAALQLVEQGKIDLAAPVDEYLPEFAERQVLVGFDGDTPRMRPAASQATVKHLITHTSGLGYSFWSEEMSRWERVTGNPLVASGLLGVFNAPLLADPGTRYIYGINTDWLGRVVEVVGGTTLDVAIEEGITGPLGMPNTTFLPNDAQRAKAAPIHLKGENGKWAVLEELNQPEWRSGGHGLYSTPTDYIRFEQALLCGGELEGERILSSETVEAAFTNQIGDLDFPAELLSADPAVTCAFNAGPGHKWGYGLLLNSQDVPGARRAWSGAWAGICNTYFWIDRTSGICASIYSSFLPFVSPGALELYANFENAVYACRS
ncbi:serine hydrolase domain-containing protein [Pseudonocardia alaniniphila]|uniref:Beta-lactamase family protein n=1 Tax=Pseudonocardia alaniniphila TaxID=75291 RepID=A0ABS9TVG1_9PSEU|nr:beta-lactamase family protein [Pseudonocardia alaniniphila]MCH6172393.1 beta-lactamase family protein [Pseudonocardia alaniniphila]